MNHAKDLLISAWELVLDNAWKITAFLAILIIGFALSKILVRLLQTRMVKRDVDPTVRPFIISVTRVALYGLVIVTAASYIGIKMTSLFALLGAGGFAAGLALQGSLANFAGGVLILLLKPFKVGDYIHTGSHDGIVREIRIFYTYITTFQNQEIMIPNGTLSNNSITNYSFNNTRRLDLKFGIGYKDDIDLARKCIQEVLDQSEWVLKTPEPAVFVNELGDSSVNFNAWIWTKTANYWNAKMTITEAVKKSFDKNGVTIPFPQRDVHLYKTE